MIRSTLKNLICILLSLVVIAFCFVEMKQYRDEERQYSKELKKIQTKIDALEEEKTDIDQQIDEIDEIIDPKDASMPKVILCFKGITEKLYEDLYPVMEQAGITGTMVFEEDNMPGDDGCITKDQAKEMYDKGWNIAISAEDIEPSYDIYDDYYRLRELLQDTSDQLKSSDMKCNSVFFNQNIYQEGYAAILSEKKKDYAYMTDFSEAEDSKKVTYIQLTDLQNLYQDVSEGSGDSYLAAIFEVDSKDKMYSADYLTTLISDLNDIQGTVLCHLISPSDLADRNLSQEELDDYNKTRKNLKKQSDELDDQITDLYKN